MPRITDVTFPTSQKLAKTSYSEPCFYPGCHAPTSLKVDQPICDSHLASIYRSVSDLGKQFDQKPGKQFDQKPGKSVNSIKPFKIDKPYIPVPPDHSGGLVYFIKFADRIKIGFSRNIIKRLSCLPHEEILVLLPGTFRTESDLHAEFAHLRVQGEWFMAHPDLYQRIEELKEQHPGYRVS